jgi:hypothetical protein
MSGVTTHRPSDIGAQRHPVNLAALFPLIHFERNSTMKRSILAVAAVLALGSASAFAQTAGVQPSFNDAPDLAPITITGTQVVDQHLPKGFVGSGGPRGPATVIVQGNDQTSAKYAQANASRGATMSDAQNGHGESSPTLNDTFNYPAY